MVTPAADTVGATVSMAHMAMRASFTPEDIASMIASQATMGSQRLHGSRAVSSIAKERRTAKATRRRVGDVASRQNLCRINEGRSTPLLVPRQLLVPPRQAWTQRRICAGRRPIVEAAREDLRLPATMGAAVAVRLRTEAHSSLAVVATG